MSASKLKVSVSEFARVLFGTTVVNKGAFVEEMESRLGRRPPRWCWEDCQRVAHGVYDVEWSDANQFKEMPVKVSAELVEELGFATCEQPKTKAPAPPTPFEESAEVDDVVITNTGPSNDEPVKTRVPSEIPDGALVPKEFPGFYSTPEYSQIRQVIESGLFFPSYVTGDTGGGKSLAIKQACSTTGRELVRVNITSSTSDINLIGSYKLVDGETVWQDGPVVTAMRRGAILLLDEIDLGTDRMLCLQPVLEGSSLLIERTGEVIDPQPGFNVFATANTKGRVSSSSAKFAGTRNQNEAFLDRFALTVEYPYAAEAIEYKILDSSFDRALEAMGMTRGDDENEFFETFFKWVRSVRALYTDGTFDAHISTRRADSMLTSYAIFGGDVRKVINGGIARFDDDTKSAFARAFTGFSKEATEI